MKNYIPYPFYYDSAPVDISFLFEDEKPAGKHGFLKVQGTEFCFEDGTKARFWGANFNGCANFPDHKHAENTAKRLAKMGINLVRFHQLDSEWNTPNIFAFTKGKRVEKSEIDPISIERLDYFIYCLKKEGIYCYIDMFCYRKFKSGEGVENAHLMYEAAKPSNYFARTLIDLQKKLCKELWTHVNPYTGLAYCDDPVFVLAEIVNESDLFFFKVDANVVEPYKTEFKNKFDEWLKENKVDKKASDYESFDTDDEHLVAFKMYLHTEYYKELYDFMREIGIKIPITGTNYRPFPAVVETQRVTDFTDSHPYIGGFQFWREFERRCVSKSITSQKLSTLDYVSVANQEDMPVYISEWDQQWPNEFRAESPLFTAAVALLQGWSGCAIHTYSYTAELERMNILGKEIFAPCIGGIAYRSGTFSTWNDPAKFGLFYHSAIMTRRGDVSKSNSVIKVKPKSHTCWNQDHVGAFCEKARVIMADFDEPEENCVNTPIEGDSVTSDTGELYRNWEKNFGYINTPNTKCAYGFLGKNEAIEMSGVKVKGITDFAVVAISSLSDDPITQSKNMLLTTVGRAQNTDCKFEDTLMTDYGKPPVVIEVIEAEIEIETNQKGLTVWAVSPEGIYIGRVPTVYEDGKLKFKTGETGQSMYYLIQAE